MATEPQRYYHLTPLWCFIGMASHRSRKQCNFLAEVQTGYGGHACCPGQTLNCTGV